MNPDFYLQHDMFQGLYDKAQDWFIKSFKYQINSPEWILCRAKQIILKREALVHLRNAQKWITKK